MTGLFARIFVSVAPSSWRLVLGRAAIAAALAILPGVLGNGVWAAEPLQLRLAHVATEGSEIGRAAQRFADELEAVSAKAMHVDIHPRSTLGGMSQLWAQIGAGAIDLYPIDVGAASLLKAGRSLNVMFVPFLFRDQAHYDRFIESPLFVEEMARIDQASKTHFVGLVGHRSPRNIATTKRPIRRAADLAGVQMRVPPSRVFIKTYEAWGAVPVPVPPHELVTALRSGMVEGQSNGITSVYRPDLYRNGNPPLRFVTPLNWAFSSVGLWVSAARWATLSEDQRGWLVQAATRAYAFSAEDSAARLAEALQSYLPTALRSSTSATPIEPAFCMLGR
ncbi:MAG: TRAP transporter substrate-binding protein [Burkholderiaceae bacterium]